MANKRLFDETGVDEPQAKKVKTTSSQILEACFRGQSEDALNLLKGKPPLNKVQLNEMEILHVATKSGLIKVVKELLNLEINIDHKNLDGKTALHLAAKHGYTEIVTELLSHCAKVDNETDDNDGNTALHLASENGHVEIVAILLQNGANVDREVKRALKDEPDDKALHLAVQNGHSEVVKELLKYHPELNSPGGTRSEDISPLQLACYHGYYDIAIDLLQNGAKVDPDPEGFSPLHFASRLDVVKELLKQGADPNRKKYPDDDKNPLACAMEGTEENIDIVIELLNHGADQYYWSEIVGQKFTSLHCAISKGYVRIVKELLKYKANPNLKSYRDDKKKLGESPLEMAVKMGHQAIVTELLKHGAEVNMTNERNETALYIAIENDRTIIFKELLENGANPNLMNCEGLSPFLKAVINGKLSSVQMMLNYKADINLQEPSGKTPLHIAAIRGSQWSKNTKV